MVIVIAIARGEALDGIRSRFKIRSKPSDTMVEEDGDNDRRVSVEALGYPSEKAQEPEGTEHMIISEERKGEGETGGKGDKKQCN